MGYGYGLMNDGWFGLGSYIMMFIMALTLADVILVWWLMDPAKARTEPMQRNSLKIPQPDYERAKEFKKAKSSP